MATLTLTIARASPVSSVNRSKNFDDADLGRLQTAATARLQEDGIPSPTQGQIADYLFARVVADFKTFTRNQEASNAAAAVTTIGL